MPPHYHPTLNLETVDYDDIDIHVSNPDWSISMLVLLAWPDMIMALLAALSFSLIVNLAPPHDRPYLPNFNLTL